MRLAHAHQQRLAYLRANPPQFFDATALDMIASHARRNAELRQDVAEFRQDAVSALWFARELENVDRTIYTQPMIPMVGRSVVPIDRAIPEWARTHRWQEMTRFAEPVVVNAQTQASIPLVSVSVTEAVTDIDTYGIGWGWSDDDIATAARQGTPLPTFMTLLARDAMERRIDQTLLVGDTATGAVGLLKQPGVPVVVATTKTGGGTAWTASALGSEIVADILAVANRIVETEGATGRKAIIQMSLAKRLRLDQPMTGAGMVVTDGGDTIYKYLMRNYEDRISRIIASPRCADAGAGGVQRMMAQPEFASESEALRYFFGLLNKEFTPYPGVWIDNGLFFKQIAVAKCGGVAVRNPEMLAYMDSI